MDKNEINSFIEQLPDDVLSQIAMSSPWQYDSVGNGYVDPDGAGVSGYGHLNKDDDSLTRSYLQEICWRKAQRNPHINTTIKRFAGRLAGAGFETTSNVLEISKAIKEIEFDPRNRLYLFYHKWVTRAVIEGELFLCLTVHNDGFVEVDFIDPACIQGTFNDTGILFHPSKTTMPLIYNISYPLDPNRKDEQIPSVFMARYPDELLSIAKQIHGYDSTLLKGSRSNDSCFKVLGGFKRFIVSWDKGWLTQRNIGHIRAILEWVELYENLKKWEADYKKACSAYAWVFEVEDKAAYRMWLQMSDEDKKKSGIMAKKTPGSTLLVPPGIKAKILNPTLPSISDEDRDILMMINSGLDAPEDETTGESRGTFASVKASRPPMVEKIADEVSYWHSFLEHDFWGSIFFLKSQVSSFKNEYKIKEVVDFDEKQKPVEALVTKQANEFLQINSPVSEIGDMEGKVKALFGVKHASLKDVAGLPLDAMMKRIGFGNYFKLRLEAETEKLKYPELVSGYEQEGMQEKQLENSDKDENEDSDKDKNESPDKDKNENSDKDVKVDKDKEKKEKEK